MVHSFARRVVDLSRWRVGSRRSSAPSNQGWLEALEKLDATLLRIQAAATDAEV
jgi:hypothetical protein